MKRISLWKRVLMVPLILLGMLGCCASGSYALAGEKDSPLWVQKVDNLPEDFILGMDASSVIAEEESGVKYLNSRGEEQDVFQTLSESGITHIRVRVWNHPYDAQGHGYGGGSNDVEKAAEIGRRAAQYGMKLIVDFHYSDFWADPAKQMVPQEWAELAIQEKSEALYDFTRQSLQKLNEAGALVGMVQLGNETNSALCGEESWENILSLMKAGSRAVREVCPDALVAVHLANPEREGAYLDYAGHLEEGGLDYDVFASSYYPYWHGTLENLSKVLGQVADTYGKKVMVMETSYAYTLEDTDFYGNTVGKGDGLTKNYPCTVQGQANEVRDVIDTIAHTENGIGVVYWEGTWISVGTGSLEENQALWEEHGSGWASRFAASYDPEDAGQYYGGNARDNQALFDAQGRPLPSLEVFHLVREGNEVPLVVDAVEDASVVVEAGGEIQLPGTVQAVMNDNSRREVPVSWDLTDERIEEIQSRGEGEVPGLAEDLPVRCQVTMAKANLLVNGSFEEGETGWTVTDLAGADELYAEDKASDSLEGTKHMHFWSAARNSVEFTLEQTVENLEPGSYQFAISVMGGDCGESEIYAYAKTDGETVASAPLAITTYGNWDMAVLKALAVSEGQSLTVGVYVKCAGEGNGAWGKIDDAQLTPEV